MRLGIVGWHDGGAGQIHSWFEGSSDIQTVCFFSPDESPLRAQENSRHVRKFSYPESGHLKELPLIIDANWWRRAKELGLDAVTIVLEDARERVRQIEIADAYGIELFSAIHPSVVISPDSSIGKSCVLFPQTFIGYRAELEDGVIINTGSQIDHHCKLERGVTLDPACVLAGNVNVKAFSHLHTSVSVINKIVIGEGSRVGAGSLVIRNIKPNTLNYGVPSREIVR